MLKHEYLKNTRVVTKFGPVQLGPDGEFQGITKEQEKELAKSKDTKLVADITTTTTTSSTSTTKKEVKTRKPRVSRKATTKKE